MHFEGLFLFFPPHIIPQNISKPYFAFTRPEITTHSSRPALFFFRSQTSYVRSKTTTRKTVTSTNKDTPPPPPSLYSRYLECLFFLQTAEKTYLSFSTCTVTCLREEEKKTPLLIAPSRSPVWSPPPFPETLFPISAVASLIKKNNEHKIQPPLFYISPHYSLIHSSGCQLVDASCN